VCNFRHIDVFHSEKLRNRLQTIFKREDTLARHITELSGKESFVIRDILVKLIPELKTFVDLDLRFYLGGDYRDREHISEVLCQGCWVDPFYCTTSQLSKGAQ